MNGLDVFMMGLAIQTEEYLTKNDIKLPLCDVAEKVFKTNVAELMCIFMESKDGDEMYIKIDKVLNKSIGKFSPVL